LDHLKRVTDEFARQAPTFDVWAAQTDDQVVARFAAALGEAASVRWRRPAAPPEWACRSSTAASSSSIAGGC
jgi:hypothetical protein